MSTICELFDLTGRVAIVTGGSRGLGKEIASGLGEAGAKVVISARREGELIATAGELRDRGIDCHAIAGSTADPDGVEALVAGTLERYGRIDILVNNAGISWKAPALETTMAEWQKVMDTNATGCFLVTQAVAREMVSRGTGGCIVNVASLAGLLGSPPEVMDVISYHASKGAVISMTRTLAVHWARHNIRVNAVAPGFFPTQMSRVIVETNQDALNGATPMRRVGRSGELKGAVVFLASDASSYITGQVLPVDGGASAW